MKKTTNRNRLPMLRVTLQDVAREAGVDVSTASRALNGRRGVRAAVREKVLEVARRLNYRPDLLARGLVTGRSNTIGLLLSDIRNPFMTELARGAEDAAQEAGFDVILCNCDLDPARQLRYFSSLLDKRVGGVIMNYVAPLKPAEWQQIADSHIPIVLLSRAPRGSLCSTVRCDNERGGRLVAEYLLKLGHRKVAHLTGIGAHPNLRERWRGFYRAMKEGAPEAEPVLLRGSRGFRGGFALAQRLLAKHPDVTAIFAANDAMAFGAARAIYAAGLRIPEDISLVGFDDVELAAVVHPPLTTVHQPIYEMGRAAVEIILRTWRNSQLIPEHRVFEVRLVERASCAPPRR